MIFRFRPGQPNQQVRSLPISKSTQQADQVYQMAWKCVSGLGNSDRFELFVPI